MHYVPKAALEGKSVPSDRAIARRMRKDPPGFRALFAMYLTKGVPGLPGLTHAQAAKVAYSSVSSLAIAKRATHEERKGLKSGALSLRQVRKAHTTHRPMTDIEILDFIEHAGPGHVLEVLDAMTAPLAMAAE